MLYFVLVLVLLYRLRPLPRESPLFCPGRDPAVLSASFTLSISCFFFLALVLLYHMSPLPGVSSTVFCPGPGPAVPSVSFTWFISCCILSCLPGVSPPVFCPGPVPAGRCSPGWTLSRRAPPPPSSAPHQHTTSLKTL
jgi:hypothetical protein